MDNALIDRLLDELTPSSQQVDEDVAAFARKKLLSMQRLDPEVRKRRIWSMLARRGFEPDTIRSALAGLADLMGPDDDKWC